MHSQHRPIFVSTKMIEDGGRTMAATQHITLNTTSLGARIAAFVESKREDYAKWRLFRKSLGELRSLSNRDLADLGLHRSELKRVALEAVYPK